ncbi:hypothetical protein ACE6H2_015551 [Prunus campanulata]
MVRSSLGPPPCTEHLQNLLQSLSNDLLYPHGLRFTSMSPMMWASLVYVLVVSMEQISSTILPTRRIGGLSLRGNLNNLLS